VFDLTNTRSTTENILEALEILRGTKEGLENISLEEILKNIGIDTSTLNIDEGLLPSITAEDLDDIIETVRAEEGVEITKR